VKPARQPLDDVPGAPVPAHLAPFVEVLGADAAVEFLLKFGGGVSYFSENPQERSALVAAIGAEKTRALARRLGAGSLRVPTGKKFIARYWKDRGLNVTAIARKLHVTDTTVRAMLRGQDDRQLTLFDLPPPD